MKYEIKNLKKSEIEIKVEITDENLKNHKEDVIKSFQKNMEVKGFRKGNVPREIVIEKMGDSSLTAQAQEKAIQKSYVDIIIKEDLQILSRPKISVESQNPFIYKVIVAVIPETKIDGYKDIKVKIEKAEVKEKEVKDFLENLEKRHTEYEKADKKIEKGDKVEVDFEGFDEENKAVENTKSTNHPVVIGDKTLIDGFEDEMIGLKKGEKKEFTITFPKDYFKKDFQNKKMKFKIEIKEVFAAKKPEFTEELIEKITGQKMKFEDFKKDIKEKLLKQKEEENKQKAENEYVKQLVKTSKIELPEILIEDELNYIISDIKENLRKRKIKFEDYLKQLKTTEEELKKKHEKDAKDRVIARLALREAIKQEKIEITDEKIKSELEKIKSFYPAQEHEKIDNDFKNGQLKDNIANRLALREFFEKMITN